ncbi:hypothetical protein [Bosea thiooxidans]|nr:hypothetical protein [Bosea thiooxidans]
MTLILEFERKLIFYKPGILRYAMRQARMQLQAAQSRAERHQLLSLSLKRGWAEAKAQLAGFQRLRAAPPARRDERSQQARHDALQVAGRSDHNAGLILARMDVAAIASPEAALSPPLARRQLH